MLAAELVRLGIPWVTTSETERPQLPLAPERLLAALASSDEARLRLALIPLCLARPDYGQSVVAAAGLLTGLARITLISYYTATLYLQKKYARQLARIGIEHESLPDYFGSELDLPHVNNPDTMLRLLAKRQAEMSDRHLNWYGTYEHAAKRFLSRSELEITWAVN